MEAVVIYAAVVKQVILDLVEDDPGGHGVTPMLSFDDERQRYMLIDVGWQGTRRIHSLLLHIHSTDGKIWIEHDGTPPPGFAVALVAAGVPKDNIVLAFHHPRVRPLTDFAVA
jgi:hypothetical protein